MTILYMDEYHHHLTIHFADGTIQESEKKASHIWMNYAVPMVVHMREEDRLPVQF